MRIRGVDLINYIIYKGLVSCWGPKPLASEVMSSSPSMLSIVVGFCSSAMVGNIWYLFHWRWLPNFTQSLRSSSATVGDDLFKSRRRIGAPWPSWCGCIVCAMSDEQQWAMCLSDYDLFRIKISWRSLLEFLRGFVCLDEAPYTARWPWWVVCCQPQIDQHIARSWLFALCRKHKVSGKQQLHNKNRWEKKISKKSNSSFHFHITGEDARIYRYTSHSHFIHHRHRVHFSIIIVSASW